MIKKFFYLSLFLLLACTTSKKQFASTENKTNQAINVVIENSSNDREFTFIVQNKSEGPVFIHNHRQIHIERQINSQWEKVRVLNCPCGASCAKPDEFLEIAQEGNFIFNWDKNESWCGERNSYGIPETMKLPVVSGVYRVMIVFSTDQKNVQIYYKEFNV